MSDDDEFTMGRFRWVLVFALIFACSLVWSLFDIAFLIFAREGTATVTKVWETSSRRSSVMHVKYSFKEPDGHERTGETTEHSFESVPAEGEEIAIQYLPRWMLDAPDASRPTRSFSWLTLAVLLITSTGFGFFLYRAIYHPDGSAPRKPPSRRR